MNADSRRFEKSVRYLLLATSGGPMRARIIGELLAGSKNTNQLSQSLGVDYKTVAHHLGVLLKMNWATRGGEKYAELYSLTFTGNERSAMLAVIGGLGKKL